ncbi:hypothetical protein ABIF66_005787 [Bradyrhizobium japonicum]
MAILDQALHRTSVFDVVFLDEDVDRGFSFGPVWGQIDVPQVVLHGALHGFGDLVEYVAHFMAPASLVPRAGKGLVQCLPEAEGAVADGELRGNP